MLHEARSEATVESSLTGVNTTVHVTVDHDSQGKIWRDVVVWTWHGRGRMGRMDGTAAAVAAGLRESTGCLVGARATCKG